MTNQQHTGTCLGTYSGKLIDLADPRPEDIELDDINQGLQQVRWNGQTIRPWTIGLHSILVAAMVPNRKRFKLGALFHDAHEAYTGDIVKPFKTDEIRKREQVVQNAILKTFGIEWDENVEHYVKEADIKARHIEAAFLLPGSELWLGTMAPLDVVGCYTLHQLITSPPSWSWEVNKLGIVSPGGR